MISKIRSLARQPVERKLEVSMRPFAIALALTLVAATAVAQQPAAVAPAQEIKTFASSADVAALIAKAKSERKEGQAIVNQPILQLAPYKVNLVYRASIGNAALHEREAEIIYVIEGAATMVTGGKLVNEARTNAENLTGTAIEGGTSRPVEKGDFIIVPENTPHWFSAISGAIVLIAVHVPRPVAATR
jgi:mannose-6-phosphate isomerase-like protein (cupin superfamily)